MNCRWMELEQKEVVPQVMEMKESKPDIEEAGNALFKTQPPALILPPRNSADVLVRSSETTPSPMTLVNSFFAEQEPESDSKSYSQLLSGAMSSPTSLGSEWSKDKSAMTGATYIETPVGTNKETTSGDRLLARDSVNKVAAANGGSGSVRPSTARFKTMTPSRLPIPRSPYLTIPPGLSPTTLLDSPVLLSTVQAEPSPTTGTFPLPPLNHGSGSASVPASDSSKDRRSDQDGSPNFVFKPFPELGKNQLSSFSSLQPLAEAQVQEPLVPVNAVENSGAESLSMGSVVSFVNAAKLVPPLQCRGPMDSKSLQPFEKAQTTQLPVPPHMVERPSEDGYNWRKYGQKQVKGSEYPRSYYKCTHPNCPVKKKVERSHDGQVTEIVYKGEHNHPKPQATRRMSMGGSRMSDNSGREGFHSTLVVEKEGTSASVKASGPTHGQLAGLKGERKSLVSDPSSLSKSLSTGASGTPELSSDSTSDPDGSRADDGDEDAPSSKRRKEEKAKEAVPVASLRTIREPRVVVQTTSDVDILDDGYRWRKYGQKVVKGNPHPRSYYKCTNLGCSVRKHVERSSTDPKAVITTYEGKHNHDVPAARNSNHDTSGLAVPSSLPPPPSYTGLGSNVAAMDRFLYGELLEDRLRVGDRMPVGFGLGGGATTSGSIDSAQQNKGQGGLETLLQTSVSMSSPGITGTRSLEGNESFVKGFVSRPKEEQVDGHVDGSSLQTTFSSSSSFSQGMQQRLVLNP
eukprot:c27962_g2_i1 orf=584-2809(+)